MEHEKLWLVVPLVMMGACSSSAGSTGSATDPNGEVDGAAGMMADGAAVAFSLDGGQLPHDGAPGASSDGARATAGSDPAGKAGADAFCTQICDHEQGCASAYDAAGSLANCQSSCQSVNEAPSANPPTELLRADYVSALGACIASSSCSTPLQTSEARCAAAAVSGGGDGGKPAIVPTQAVAVFCRAFETSPCLSSEAGAQDCVSAMMVYSDPTLNAALACFSDSSCATVGSCYAAAFMQP